MKAPDMRQESGEVEKSLEQLHACLRFQSELFAFSNCTMWEMDFC